jgi:hypothetical protein
MTSSKMLGNVTLRSTAMVAVFQAKNYNALERSKAMSEIYWGCHACGHEMSRKAKVCWDCEKPRQFYWLDEAGEHTARPSLAYRIKYWYKNRSY